MTKNYCNSVNPLRGWFFLLVFLTGVSFVSNAQNSRAGSAQAEIYKSQLNDLLAGQELTENYLVKFDTLDFVAFTHQEWERFHESHAENIKVYWPDGHFTEGLPRHVQDMKALFVYAPDTRIKEHPIRFGSGQYTAVTGLMEGTFTEPMPMGNGDFIQPTGKSFSIPMCTIGIWENGVMVEEHLFWDNYAYLQQLGIAQ